MNRFFALVALVFGLAFANASALAQPSFSKQFTANTVGPGGSSTLTFTIDNTGGGPATALAFTDTLPAAPAAMTIANSPNASTTCDILTDGGTLSAPAGGSTISLSGGRVAAGAICTVSVNVTAGTATGVYSNASGDLTSSAGNSGTAIADLTVVSTLPSFSKAFSPNSISFNQITTLTFTIDNTLNASRIGSLDFTDNLPGGLTVAPSPNATTNCVAASAPDTTITAVPGSTSITLDADGSTIFAGFEVLPIGATCTVSVDVIGSASGTFENVTTDLLADFTAAGKATAMLTVTPLSTTEPTISKLFTAEPASAGANTPLRFEIFNPDRNFPATDVAFTDDLTAVTPTLAGLSLNSVVSNTCGGTVSGSTTIALSGGTIPASSSCVIEVLLAVPAGAAGGDYVNTTTTVTATINGSAVASASGATDTLTVSNEPEPTFVKEFTDDPVLAGNDVTLRFTITNNSTTSMATDLAFVDEIVPFLPFPASVVTPGADPCGTGSSVALVSTDIDKQGIRLTGGNIAMSDSCTFDVTITVPAGFPSGTYTNTSGDLTGTVGGTTFDVAGASDDLVVAANVPLQLSKEFSPANVGPGDTTTLTFVLTNPTDTTTVTGVSFTDDLTAMTPALSGVTVTGPPAAGFCGAGSTASTPGGNTLSFADISLAPQTSCTFSATVNVPAGATANTHTNTTSDLTGPGGPEAGTAASANLTVSTATPPTFSKTFVPSTAGPGDQTVLRFTIDNTAANSGALTGMFFTDNLQLELPGLAANAGGLPTDPCGTGSSITGTTFLIFVGGNLPAGGSCTFDVTVDVPPGAALGTFANITSSLTATIDGVASVINPTTANLTVAGSIIDVSPATGLTATGPVGGPFSPTSIDYTVSNVGTQDLDYSVVPVENFFEVTSGNATGTIMPGNSVIVTVAFDGVNAPALAAGVHTGTINFNNTTAGASLGNGNTTRPVSLTVTGALPTFAKQFLTDPVAQGGTTTLRFTIDNTTTGGAAISGVNFTDDLNAALAGLTATGLPQTDVCGTGSSISGTSTISLTGGNLAGGASCTIDVTVQVPGAAATGAHVNTTSDLRDGTGGILASPATATLNVVAPANMTVAPTTGLTSSGVQGSTTFTPEFVDYTVSNTGGVDLAYTVAPAGGGTAPVTITNPSGTITPGNDVTVRVGINTAAASALAAGNFASTINFTNTTNGVGDVNRAVDLTVLSQANLTVTAGDYSASGVEGSGTYTPASINYTLENTGQQAMTYSITGAPGYITVTDPGGGNLAAGATTVVTLSINTGVADGFTVAASPITGTVNFNNTTNGSGSTSRNTTLTILAPASLTVSAGDLTSSGNQGGMFTPNSIVYTLTNTGAEDLDFTVTPTGAPLFTQTSAASGTIGPGGNTTVTISLNPAVVGTLTPAVYANVINFANVTTGPGNGQGDTTRNANLTVINPPGFVTITQNTDADGTFAYASAEPLLTFNLVTTGGTGTQGPVTLPPATYVVTVTPPAGFSTSAIACNDADSTGVAGTGVITIVLASAENVTCTVTSSETVNRTRRIIANFIQRRNDALLANEPDGSRFIYRHKGGFSGSNGFGGAGGFNGSAPDAAFAFSVNPTGAGEYAFSTSLARVIHADQQVYKTKMSEIGITPTAAEGLPQHQTFDMWIEGKFTYYDDGNNGDGYVGVGYLGFDYLVTPDLLLGILGSVDVARQDGAAANSRVDGVGWLIGPYLSFRMTENLFFYTRAAWGESSNDISPFGTYVDNFKTQRWLVRGRLSGSWNWDNWSFTPSVSAAYIEDKAKSYVDSNNLVIPGQTIALGQLKFDPRVGYTYRTSDGTYIKTGISLQALWNFTQKNGAVAAGNIAGGNDVRGRAKVDLNVRTRNGVTVGLEGTYDGIGAKNFDAVGGSVKVRVPLN